MASGAARLEFFTTIVQTQPFPSSSIPSLNLVPITISGLLRAEASGTASAEASVVITEGPYVSLDEQYVPRSTDVNLMLDLANNSRTMPFSVNRVFSSGDLLRTTLFAESAVSVLAPDSGGFSGEGDGFVDPTFSFDQSTFDAYAALRGFPAFPLDQYLAFEFSPDLIGMGVPEPSSALLMLSASALLGISVAARRVRETAARRTRGGPA